MAATAAPGKQIRAMARPYCFSAHQACRTLPVPAHTASGTIITMQAMTVTVLRKVSIWR